MIIDFHYHFPHQVMDEAALVERAQRMERFYAAGGRAGLPITAGQMLPLMRGLFAPDPDGSRLLSRMDKANIDITVAVVVDRLDEWPEEAQSLAANKACAGWCRQHPDRLIAFAGVDPRRPNAPDMLRRCVGEYGSPSPSGRSPGDAIDGEGARG